MCGIVGVQGVEIDKNFGDTLLDLIAHRGPDSRGSYELRNELLWLGHTRLSFLDLSENGHQPMKNGGNLLVFNGEIYNYRQLAKGSNNANSDTRVLSDLLLRESVKEVAERLVGMFAFAYYDEKTKILSLVRDISGEKPLFYSFTDKLFVFSSEIKPILELRDENSLNSDSLITYIEFGFVNNGNQTIYDDVFTVLPGEMVHFDLTNREVRREKYVYKPSYSGVLDEQSEQDTFDRLFLNAVRSALVSDIRLSLFFSGGLDSTAILVAMKELGYNEKIFTFKFSQKGYDESENAQRIADSLGYQIEVVSLDDDSIKGLLESTYNRFDQPFADVSVLPLKALFDSTSFKGVLTGDGGDEFQGGYERHKIIRIYFNLYLQYIPLWVKRKLFKFLLGVLKKNKDGIFLMRLKKAKNLFNFSEIKYNRLFGYNSDRIKSTNREDLIRHLEDLIEKDISEYLPNNILYKSDTLSMASSMESRSPFLNQELISFLRSDVVPNSKNFTRNFLKRRGIELPKSKKGFVSPVYDWLNGPLSDEVQSTFEEFGLLGKSKYWDSDFTWRIYILCLWLRNNNVVGLDLNDFL